MDKAGWGKKCEDTVSSLAHQRLSDEMLTFFSETIKRVLALPPETNIVWKSHDDSIAQRMSIDQARQEKASQHSVEKRRATLSNEEGTPLKEKGNDS